MRTREEGGKEAFHFVLGEAPEILEELRDKSTAAGNKVALEARVKGKPKTIKWYKNGQLVKPDKKRLKTEDAEDGACRLVISAAEAEDSAQYKLEVSNDFGSASSQATLTVTSM